MAFYPQPTPAPHRGVKCSHGYQPKRFWVDPTPFPVPSPVSRSDASMGRSRSAAIAVLLLGCVADRARAGLHQETPTSYSPLPRASAATRLARSARSIERSSSDLDVVTTASGEFFSGLAKVDPMDACFVDSASPPPADPKNGRRKTFSRHLCQVTPLNHSFDTFVTRCDSDHIADLQDKGEDFEARVGTVSVAVGVDGPSVISYAPRSGHQSRKRRDVSGTQHCIQRRSTPGVTPAGNSCMRRNVLMMQVDFLDSIGHCDLACIRASMWLPQGASNQQAANEAFKASSYGQTEYDEATSAVIRVTIQLNVGYTDVCDTNGIAERAEALAVAAGYTMSDYHHRVFFIPANFGGGACGWGGLARSPGDWVWMRVDYGIWYFLEHEIGHNREGLALSARYPALTSVSQSVPQQGRAPPSHPGFQAPPSSPPPPPSLLPSLPPCYPDLT